jgi:YD repeat-containing protein
VCVDDPSQRKEFSYDRMGRIKKERRSVKTSPPGGDEFFETRYAHDLQSRVTQMVYPKDPLSGKYLVAHYRHVPAGVCGMRAEIGTEHKDLITGIEYNEFGQVVTLSRGNGVETAYEYDARGRTARMVSTVSSNDQKRKLQDVRYALRSDNCIASIENTPDIDTEGGYVSNIRADYRYDGLKRLVRASGTYRRSALPNGDPDENTVKQYELRYGYAPNGNMEFKEVLDPWSHAPEDRWSYRRSNHAATRIDSTRDGAGCFEMRYDPVGNMVYQEDRARRLTRELHYDSKNRVL